MDQNDPRTVDERNMLHDDALDSSRYPADTTNGTAPENEEHGEEAIGAGAGALGGAAVGMAVGGPVGAVVGGGIGAVGRGRGRRGGRR